MAPTFQFDTSHIKWTHLTGGPPEFDYPIDYEMAVLGYQVDKGLLDLIVKWAPNSYCHFHRHAAATTTLVLEGEHIVDEIRPNGETVRSVRPAGTYRHSAGGDVHMESAGPNGATVFFAMHAIDGRLFELLDKDQNIIATNTVEEFAAQNPL